MTNNLFRAAIICCMVFIQAFVTEGQNCGRTYVTPRSIRVNQTTGHRIVGGIEAKPHSFPWTVSVRNTAGGWHFCGGTLIRSGNAEESDIVITASHCLEQCDISVAVGAHSRSQQASGEQLIRVTKCVKHEQYNPANWYEHDIAVLKLERPVKFSQTIQPVCLPNMNERIGDNVYGTVAGWGYTKEGGPGSQTLLQVTVPTIDHQTCNSKYSNMIRSNAHLCAGYMQGGKDSCQGDSGGPFIFNTNRGYTLHGVVSFGDGCARPDKPGVYARVSSYIDWINGKIRSLSGSQGTGGGGSCSDNITYCHQYQNECNTADWLKTHCKKTCNFC